MKLNSTSARTLLLAGSVTVVVAALTGCSKSTPPPPPPSLSPVPTPSATPSEMTVSPTSTRATTKPASASCTTSAVKAVLPSGAILNHFNCAGSYAGAYATVAGKKSGYVFKSENGKWVVVTTDVCGAASAGLSKVILAYCPK